MTKLDPHIFDDLFHGCAWPAYVDQATADMGPPDSEATRIRAYRYYEEELAAKNAVRADSNGTIRTPPEHSAIDNKMVST